MDSTLGRFIYSKRIGTVEPVFANIKNALSLDRFTLRGSEKVDIQWDVAQSYALVDEGGSLLGFAQVFDKFGCKHLGRIAVSPEMRGKNWATN